MARARALRIERPGGRFHVTARANERKDLFRDDTDHFHFLELLSAVTSKAIARFGRRLAVDASLSAQMTRIQNQLSK